MQRTFRAKLRGAIITGAALASARHDGVILGGTWDHDDWSLRPDPEQAAGILETHVQIMKGLKS
ncbi:MAG TPA: hypothetical protein VFS76_20100 [Pyrinomonadaceae bacterium]|nr:hypothetical protein [Pyrinomonadaceae bacterium]